MKRLLQTPRIITAFTLSLLLPLLIAGHAMALQLVPIQVSPGIYAFIGDTGMRSYENEGLNANTGFIVTKAGVVVVDSGSSYLVGKAMHAAIRKVTQQPLKYVINTGGQDHRWLGNGYFKEIGVPIIASKKARADMEVRGATELDALKPVLREKLAGTQTVYPDHLVDKSETLKLGGTEIQILYFDGGHTPGDAVVWLPESKVVFSGDLIFVDRLLGVLPFSHTRDWIASFDEIAKLKPEIIVPGHGQVCDLPKARRDTRDYLELLRNHMGKALENMTDLQTAIDTLDQNSFKYLENFELLKGGNASRTYLEMESE